MYRGSERNEDILLFSPKFLKQKEYWLKKLAVDLGETDLFSGNKHSGPAETVGSIVVPISEHLSGQILKLSKNADLSIYIVLLAGLKTLIHKRTFNRNITTLSPIYKVNSSIDTINDFVFINTPVDEDITFKDLIIRIKNSVVEAYKNQDYPFEKIIGYLSKEKPKADKKYITNVECKLKSIHGDSEIKDIKGKLSFVFEREENRVKGYISYDPARYEMDYLKQISKHYVRILEEGVKDLNVPLLGISMLSEIEKNRLLIDFNNNDADFSRDNTIAQIIEYQAKVTPDSPAICCGEKEVTYRELNERANSLARDLREAGIGTDKPVGILLGRSDIFVEAILGVWKARGAYIPIDPEYPVKRISAILEDSRAGVLITDSRYIDSKPETKFNGHIIRMDRHRENTSRDETRAMDLDLDTDMDSLAYIIYTSGSTGRPKGVMVEHIGMMNHIQSKINTLDIDAGSIVAQNASHTFDISVWQLFVALTRAAKTVIYPNDTVMVPERFLTLVEKDAVTILEVVPSYLSMILDALEQTPGRFEQLCYLLVTGEEVKPGLVERWFNKYPRIKMVNAYGPTEASDDITHHVMDKFQARARVSIGKPIQNLNIYIVDGNMNLVPAGVKGEICVSGVGVGRGYLNDPEKTDRVFTHDPFEDEIVEEGKKNRLYKTGDWGTWQPDGTINFFGRIDNQLKIRGYRIELGEIESKLVNQPRIKDAVVIATEGAESFNENGQQDKYLCAYLLTDGKTDISNLKNALLEELPEYMVPVHFVELEQFPLTTNGKVDRKALAKIEIKTEQDYIGPRDEIEKKLVDVFESVLGRDTIGINENFFMIGGDSIKSIQIASRLFKIGYKIKMRDIFQNPSILELAPLVKKVERVQDQSVVTGILPLTPIQVEFFTRPRRHRNHYNQAVMLYSEDGFEEKHLKAVFAKLTEHHDTLRMTYKVENGEVVQRNNGLESPTSFMVYDFRSQPDEQLARQALEAKAGEIQKSIDIETGPLMKTALFKLNDGDRLLIVIHHLVIDGISWRILFEDIENLYTHYKETKGKGGQEFSFKTDSFKAWAEKMVEYADSESLLKEKAYWAEIESAVIPAIEKEFDVEDNLTQNKGFQSFTLTKEETTRLLTKVNNAFGTEINDILLCGLGLSIREIYRIERVLISLEAHGREEIFNDIDVNRTVGWFTSIYPVLLDMSHEQDLSRQIKEVKETLHRVPNGGIGYGILKYLTARENKKEITFKLEPRICFNYFGEFDRDVEQMSFGIAKESVGKMQSSEDNMEYEWEINGMIKNGRLEMTIGYNTKQYNSETIKRLFNRYRMELNRVISYCVSRENPDITPSDLTYPHLEIESLEQLKQQYPVKDIYALSPMQEGMLFHALFQRDTATYFEQISYRLNGNLDISCAEKSANELLKRYDILRTAFIYEGLERPLQVVLKERTLDFHYENIEERMDGKTGKEVAVREFKENDRARPFDLGSDVLMRISVLRTGESEYEFTWSFHHILMDGWCLGILVSDFSWIYSHFIQNKSYELPAVKPYRTYIQWLEKQETDKPGDYWTRYLENYDETAGIPGTQPVSANTGSYINQRVIFRLDTEKTKKLTELAGRNQVTVNTIYQVAWGILLSKYSGKRDVVFGIVVSGRPSEIGGVESMVGLFINTIPIRIQPEEKAKVNHLLKKAQEDMINSENFHHYPLSHIQANSQLKHNLLDHLVIYENYPIAERIDGLMDKNENNPSEVLLKIANIDVFEQTNYDFNVVISPGNHQHNIELKFNANVYPVEFVEKIAGHFKQIIHHILYNDDPYVENITMLSEEEKNQLLYKFNDTAEEYPEHKTIHQLFEEQVEKTPDRIAVQMSDGLHLPRMTYTEINRESNRLAHLLVKNGVRPDTIVGVLMERSVKMIIGILGILKAGGAYLPIDSQYPEARKQFIVEDSGATILLSERSKLSETIEEIDLTIIPGNTPCGFSTLPTQPNHLAYIIYTSGSTGKPKGVMIEHRGVVNYIRWAVKKYVIDERANFPLYTSISFDLTVTSLFTPLLSGGAVVVYREEENEFGLERVIKENMVDVVKVTPSHLKAIRDKKTDITGSRIKRFIVGGEELETALALDIQRMFNGDIEIFNEYGPTETVVGTMIYKFNPETDTHYSVPIGVPIDNTHIYVLNGNRHPVPPGVLGELCVSGDNLARGYLGRTELTSEKFIKNPYVEGTKLYRTGDLARFMPDGNIHFAGRIDSQVKIRGFRIEPGEIESLLLRREELKDAVVLERKDNSGNPVLCAYLVYKRGREPEIPELREYLAEKLPVYMIPGYFTPLENMPLTPNGKVDKKQLPAPEVKAGADYIEPETSNEKIIADIWQDVLGLDKVGVHDNFFDLGGNSMLSIKIAGRFKEVFKRDIPIVTMYRYLTIREFARFLEQEDSNQDFIKKDRSKKISDGKNRLKKTMKLKRKNER